MTYDDGEKKKSMILQRSWGVATSQQKNISLIKIEVKSKYFIKAFSYDIKIKFNNFTETVLIVLFENQNGSLLKKHGEQIESKSIHSEAATNPLR